MRPRFRAPHHVGDAARDGDGGLEGPRGEAARRRPPACSRWADACPYLRRHPRGDPPSKRRRRSLARPFPGWGTAAEGEGRAGCPPAPSGTRVRGSRRRHRDRRRAAPTRERDPSARSGDVGAGVICVVGHARDHAPIEGHARGLDTTLEPAGPRQHGFARRLEGDPRVPGEREVLAKNRGAECAAPPEREMDPPRRPRGLRTTSRQRALRRPRRRRRAAAGSSARPGSGLGTIRPQGRRTPLPELGWTRTTRRGRARTRRRRHALRPDRSRASERWSTRRPRSGSPPGHSGTSRRRGGEPSRQHETPEAVRADLHRRRRQRGHALRWRPASVRSEPGDPQPVRGGFPLPGDRDLPSARRDPRRADLRREVPRHRDGGGPLRRSGFRRGRGIGPAGGGRDGHREGRDSHRDAPGHATRRCLRETRPGASGPPPRTPSAAP